MVGHRSGLPDLTRYTIHPGHKKKEPEGSFFVFEKEVLFVVDVHRDFKTKTDVAVFRSFPFHCHNPHVVSLRL